MTTRRITLMLLIIAGMLYTPGLAFPQNAITAPGQKSNVRSRVEMVPSLLVMNARSANLRGQTLTLMGVSPSSIVFADRPVRAAGHALTVNLLKQWAATESFGKDPPNATVSILSKDGSSMRDAVVVLKSPKMDGDQLTFNVQVLEGNLMEAEGPASVFIDMMNRPYAPMSGYTFLD